MKKSKNIGLKLKKIIQKVLNRKKSKNKLSNIIFKIIISDMIRI